MAVAAAVALPGAAAEATAPEQRELSWEAGAADFAREPDVLYLAAVDSLVDNRKHNINTKP